MSRSNVQVRKAPHQGARGFQIHRGVFADRRVRAAAGFDAHDPLRRKNSAARQEFRIFASVNIIRDYGELIG
jgi:hypothetical protein